MSSDLVSRLLETLDELERVALGASPGPWRPNAEHDEVLAVDGVTVCDGFALSTNQWRITVEHIAHWDPQAVLRLVEAVRQVIDKYRTAQTTVEVSEGTVLAGAMKVSARAYLEVLKLIAAGLGITEED